MDGLRPLRSVALLMGGVGVGAALLIASSPVLSRLYDPESFGTRAAVRLPPEAFVGASVSTRC